MKKIINPYIGSEKDSGYNCFACAPHNPYGLKMEFYEDGDEVVSYWKAGTNYQGWVDTLHGGIQATLVDETSSWLISRKKQVSGMTTNLSMKYMKPIPCGTDEPVEIHTYIKEEKRNFVFIEATILYKGEVCSKGETTFFCFSKEKSEKEFQFRQVNVEE